MNRRQVNKLLGCILAAPVEIAALGSMMSDPYVLQQGTWTNKIHQSLLSTTLNFNLLNAGMPEAGVHVGFPLQRSFNPEALFSFNIHEIGLGSEYASEAFDHFDPNALMAGIERQIDLDPQETEQMLERLNKLQEAFESLQNQGIGFTIFMGLFIFSMSIFMIHGAYENIHHPPDYDKDGVEDDEDAYPYDPYQQIMAPDRNDNGIPDDMEDDIFWTFVRDTLGNAQYFSEKSQAFISFNTHEKMLVIDTAISVEGETSTVRFSLEG